MSVTNTMNAKRVTDEVRHAQEDLEHFYLEAKRNKKLAKWAAKKLGVDHAINYSELNFKATIDTKNIKPNTCAKNQLY